MMPMRSAGVSLASAGRLPPRVRGQPVPQQPTPKPRSPLPTPEHGHRLAQLDMSAQDFVKLQRENDALRLKVGELATLAGARSERIQPEGDGGEPFFSTTGSVSLASEHAWQDTPSHGLQPQRDVAADVSLAGMNLQDYYFVNTNTPPESTTTSAAECLGPLSESRPDTAGRHDSRPGSRCSRPGSRCSRPCTSTESAFGEFSFAGNAGQLGAAMAREPGCSGNEDTRTSSSRGRRGTPGGQARSRHAHKRRQRPQSTSMNVPQDGAHVPMDPVRETC